MPPRSLHRAAVASTVVALLSLALTVGVWLVEHRGGDGPGPPVAAGGTPAHVAVLRAWDARRARAWAASDPEALRALYVAGSRTGTRDVRMLRRYRSRGLRVVGLETQLVSVVALRSEPERLLLDVVDRVSAAQVVGEGTRRSLPDDRPTRRHVDLRRVDGDWLVGEVRDPGAGPGP